METAELLSSSDLLALLECAKLFATETNLDHLVGTILDKACAMTNSPDGSIYLHDVERGGLFFAAAAGSKGPELLANWGESSSQRVPLGSKAGKAFTSGEVIIEQQLKDDDEHFRGVDEQTRKKSRSMVCVPLRVEGKSIGVIQVLNKRDGDYDRRDGILLEHFAVQAGAAVRTLRLVRELIAHMGLYSRDENMDLVARLNAPARLERVTLLFADMRGFTQLCQSQTNPAHTQAIVNDLLTMYADQVLVRDGIVNKFLGDAVFAFFRGDKAPVRAVQCAFGMLERFETLRRKWDESSNQDLTFLDLGIGVTTDEVAVGTFGSSRVRDFTAVGNAVNLASAFEAAARSGRRLLVDQATWSAVRDIVADSEGPQSYELRKPGQTMGVVYRQYHLKRLKPETPVRVFISHNREDRVFVEEQITGPLKTRGIETWYSNTDIIPGKKFTHEIEAGLLKSDWLILIVSRHSAASDWVRAEVETALQDPRLQGRILPVITDETSPAYFGAGLAQVQGLDARKLTDTGEQLFRLLTRSAGAW